jgi:hypothetical protein
MSGAQHSTKCKQDNSGHRHTNKFGLLPTLQSPQTQDCGLHVEGLHIPTLVCSRQSLKKTAYKETSRNPNEKLPI